MLWRWSLWAAVHSWYHQKQWWWWHLCIDCLEHYSCCHSTFHTSPIQEAIPPNLIALNLCWANFWKSMWETYWLTTVKNSIFSLSNSGVLPMVNPPLKLYSQLLITGTDYLIQDLTSALYSSTLVKCSTQSATDPYYRSSKTLMFILTLLKWLTHYLSFRHQ